MKRAYGFAAIVAALLGLSATLAGADSFPSRTVTLIVPYPPGGSVDGVARILALKLSETTGKSFIVENRAGGAGGTIGASYVAKATPDGYTMLLTASIHVVTPFLYKTMPYNVVTDFTPISLVVAGPLIVSTTPSMPANTLKEFFDIVRKAPDKYTFATSSFGSAGHLAVEVLKHEAGVDTLVIDYRGAAPALTDLMSGQTQLMADPILSSLPLAQAGKIKALAITSKRRFAIAPEIPTVAESGMPEMDFASWYGLWGPKEMPADLVEKIQDDVVKIVSDTDVKNRFAKLGFEPIGSTSAYFAKYIKDEMSRYEQIIKDANIQSQ